MPFLRPVTCDLAPEAVGKGQVVEGVDRCDLGTVRYHVARVISDVLGELSFLYDDDSRAAARMLVAWSAYVDAEVDAALMAELAALETGKNHNAGGTLDRRR